jgi:hypothetical protein
VISSFTATPATITAGHDTTLSWTVTGATSVSIDQGIGSATGNSQLVTPPSQTTTYTYTYTLTARNGSGSVTAQVGVNVVRLEISSFAAVPATISVGDSTTLTPIFVGTGASISNGVGTVSSGNGAVVSPSATTTYTLTVTNELGDFVTRTVTVTVVPLPVINSFTAASTVIAAGTSTTLTATFANGTGAIDHSIGSVTSGVDVPTPALSAKTTYTLTVTNAAGTSFTETVTVDVFVPDADVD